MATIEKMACYSSQGEGKCHIMQGHTGASQDAEGNVGKSEGTGKTG